MYPPLRGLWGGWRISFRGFVENQSKQNIMSDNKDQPSVPAQEGLIISGTPARDVMPPGITDGMATGAPSQTVGTQGSLGSSATCVQPLPALPGDGPAEMLDPLPIAPWRASDRRRARRQKSGQTASGQVSTPTATAVGSGVTVEQSAATSSPMSVDLGASAEAGAGGEPSQLFPLNKK